MTPGRDAQPPARPWYTEPYRYWWVLIIPMFVLSVVLEWSTPRTLLATGLAAALLLAVQAFVSLRRRGGRNTTQGS